MNNSKMLSLQMLAKALKFPLLITQVNIKAYSHTYCQIISLPFLC